MAGDPISSLVWTWANIERYPLPSACLLLLATWGWVSGSPAYRAVLQVANESTGVIDLTLAYPWW